MEKYFELFFELLSSRLCQRDLYQLRKIQRNKKVSLRRTSTILTEKKIHSLSHSIIVLERKPEKSTHLECLECEVREEEFSSMSNIESGEKMKIKKCYKNISAAT